MTSSDSAAIVYEATDETKIIAGSDTVSNVLMAKKMIFELPGFTDLTSTITQSVTFNLVLGHKLVTRVLQHLIRLKQVKLIKW